MPLRSATSCINSIVASNPFGHPSLRISGSDDPLLVKINEKVQAGAEGKVVYAIIG